MTAHHVLKGHKSQHKDILITFHDRTLHGNELFAYHDYDNSEEKAFSWFSDNCGDEVYYCFVIIYRGLYVAAISEAICSMCIHVYVCVMCCVVQYHSEVS